MLMNILLQRARRLFNANNGFILPTVLIVSVIMMSALMMSLSVVWSSRQSLKNQFDLQNARNASISGINVVDGCRYGDILISDTVSASSSPLGTADCGITNSSASTNFLILKQTYGNAASSFGFKATYLKNSNDKGTFTEEPKNPSTSTNGNGQVGYLYNFCAANGGQTGNGACSESSSTAVNTGISVCPAGWRLPITGSTTVYF